MTRMLPGLDDGPRMLLEDFNRASDPRPQAAELYQLIVAPIQPDLQGAGATTIAWSLDNVLRYVPMNVLFDSTSGHYLIEEYSNVVYNTADTGLLRSQPSFSRWTALGMGVSKKYEAGLAELTAVPAELKTVVRDELVPDSRGPVPGRILLNEIFTKKAMADQLWKPYAVVHIASHFVLDPTNDDNSWLLLAGEETAGAGYRLSLADLRVDPSLDFHDVELVTLSACETAVSSENSAGREVDGLGLVVEKKGAKAVLASLWPVADESTGLLMTDFYRRWTSGKGVPKIEALRAAQLDMLRGTTSGVSESGRGIVIGTVSNKQSAYKHPRYWAPFILMGNWH